MVSLPRMKSYLFMPWFPVGSRNLSYNGKCRDDLADDVDVHYYNDGYWTLDELYKYGALPPEEADILK